MNPLSAYLHTCKPSTEAGIFFSHMDPQLEKKGKKEKGKRRKEKGKEGRKERKRNRKEEKE